jgi:hypothetical protein
MAIIACPNCAKKISSRAALCSYCGFELGEATEEDFERFRGRRLRDQRYRLSMVSYAVMTVVLAAFGWYWWDSEGFAAPPSRGPLILLGVAAVAYLGVRVMLFRNRQRLKALQREGSLRSGPDAAPR